MKEWTGEERRSRDDDVVYESRDERVRRQARTLRTQRNEKSKRLVTLRMAVREAMIELKVAHDMTGDENLMMAAGALEAAIDASYPEEMQEIRRGWKEGERQ